AANDLALIVHERRTDGLAYVRLVEVASVNHRQLVLVVERARVPVEVAVGQLEGAFQGGGEAPGGQVALGTARHFPATTAPVDRAPLIGQRVEVAVGGHRRVDCGGLQRVAGDLAARRAVGVGHVADEADVVGDVPV